MANKVLICPVCSAPNFAPVSLISQICCIRCNSWFETGDNCASSTCTSCHKEKKLNSCTNEGESIQTSQAMANTAAEPKRDKRFTFGKALFSWLFPVR